MADGVCQQISAAEAAVMHLGPEADEDEAAAPEAPAAPCPDSFLNRDQVLGAEDYDSEVVLVPHWGGAVLVRTFSGEMRDRFERVAIASQSADSDVTNLDAIIQLVINGACDAQGSPLFTDEDAEALRARDAESLILVAEAVSRLNGIGEEAVEELGKNSEGGPSADFGSD